MDQRSQGVAIPVEMRLLALSATFLLLVAALVFLWFQRFQQVAGAPVWTLEDLHRLDRGTEGVSWTQGPEGLAVRIGAAAGNGGFALRLPLPGAPAAEALHLSFRLRAIDLVQGSQVWENGRFLIEWRPHGLSESSAPETDPIGSVRFGDVDLVKGIVAVPLAGPARPSLRMENLGLSGAFELSDLRITVVEESRLWRIGRWGVLLGFLAWSAAVAGCLADVGRLRAVMVGAVWVAMGIQFVVPGPWKVQRPMGIPFALGHTSGLGQPVAPPSAPASEKGPQVIRASGDIPVQGSLPLRVKFLVTRARPVLHALMLAAPAFLIAALAGRRAAWFLAGLLAVLIELSQWAFGYGFGWDDVADLLCDAVGIVLGILLCAWVSRCRIMAQWIHVPGPVRPDSH